MTDEQKRLRDKIELLMLRRAQAPEPERAAISVEIEATADQLARLVALACHAVEQPVADYFDEWVPTPDGPGEAERVSWPPPDAA
jgi:hypothetical protein